VTDAVRRIACEQIDNALASLKQPDRGEAIHEVRQRCKKLRALVRLVRPAFPSYREENAVFRDIAGLFGGLRDAEVVQALYDDLAACSTAPPVRRRRAEPGPAHGADVDDAIQEARRRLSAARGRARGWQLDEDGWKAVRRGLVKTYARARRAMREALQAPSGEHYHAWRKAAKHYWYQSRLLKAAWPEAMKPRARLARELADALGRHHDLFVLEQRLAEDPRSLGAGSAAKCVIDLARQRREALEQRAARLGERLLRGKPRALASRLRQSRVFGSGLR
jgi:CHAD domain-containing protein